MNNFVIDTDVVISASISKIGGANFLLHLLIDNKWFYHTSSVQINEIDDTVEKLTPKFQIDSFTIELFKKHAKKVNIDHNSIFNKYVFDENDAFLVEQIIVSKANYFITYNISDFKQVEIFSHFFCQTLTPGLFLQRYRNRMI